MKIKIAADSRQAQAGLRATASAAADAAEEVKNLDQAASGGELERIMKEHRAAFDAEAAAIRKTNQALRERARVEKEISRLEAANAGNSLGNQLADAARGAVIAAPAAGAAGMVGLMTEASQRGAAWEQAESRLRVTAGADANDVSNAVERISGSYGADATALLGQAARLTKAGLNSEQAVKAIESAVVAARGDVAQVEGLLDIMAESATRGTLEEDLMGRMEENGIELRRVLMEQFNMTKEEFDAALSAGKIDVSSYFDVIDKLTGKGTAAQRAAEEAANSTAGLISRVGSEWDSIMRNFGELLNEGLVKPLAEKVLPLMQKAGDWWRDLMRDRATEDLISDIHPEYQKLLDAEAAANAGPAAKTQEELEAEAKMREAVEQRTEAYKDLKKAMLDASNADLWREMSMEDKRAAIGRNTGIGAGVTVASIDDAIRAESGMAKLARGEEISESELAHTKMLLRQRQLLAELEKQEEAALKQREHAEEALRQADRRQEILKAEIAGDEERLRLLKLQEEVEKRSAQYRQQGLDAADAEARAAEDVALENQAAEVRRAATLKSGTGESGMKTAGWIQTSLASVGGGGVSLRQYESQGLKVAKDTAQNTANIFSTAKEILNAIREPSLQAVQTVLG